LVRGNTRTTRYTMSSRYGVVGRTAVLPTTTQQPDVFEYTKCDVQLIKSCS
jgi:hypothetical protein